MEGQSHEVWRARQRQVLTKLREDSKRNRTQIATAAGLEYWQIVRLETGKSELPARLVPQLARGYDIKPQELIELLKLNQPPAPFSLRATLEASGLVPAEEIDRIEADTADWPEADQCAHAAMVLRAYAPAIANPAAPKRQPDKKARRAV